MNLILAFLGTPLMAIMLIPLMKSKGKAIVVVSAIVLNAFFSSYFAIQTMSGEVFTFVFPGSAITNIIMLKVDALSGWFILIFNFIFITGSFYGINYMKMYQHQQTKLSLHAITVVLIHSTIVSLTVIQNSIAFLIAWEIMALSAFIAVIFENEKESNIKAGINYLIQSHVSILFLMFGFIWVAFNTGSYDFAAISSYTSAHAGLVSLFLFLFFATGFAIKAGFVPFHTWLPLAHPAAPAPISGIMSGVLIKVGIFGILRMITLIHTNYTSIGYFILLVSIITGLYGVILAIMQHNLKRLLAYHSIENIGIIGMGIGLGSIGLGSGNLIIASIGFAAALLHTFNHALFKSLLFFAVGNVYQATHTVQIERLGGLLKKMPQTAIFFLIAAIAIIGIPPFNGFISEFILYSGYYYWMQDSSFGLSILVIFAVLALVLIGGLALLCFTKAFGVVFLGNPRHIQLDHVKEVPFRQLAALYFIALLIAAIGLFPVFFIQSFSQVVNSLLGASQTAVFVFPIQFIDSMQTLNWSLWIFIAVVALVMGIRHLAIRKNKVALTPTWACAYVAPNSKQQYTASSFVRTFSKIFKPILQSDKSEVLMEGIFPKNGSYQSTFYDRIEQLFIDKPIHAFKVLLEKFAFLQNGNLQFYILYGIIFIGSIIIIPLVYGQIMSFVEFIKQL